MRKEEKRWLEKKVGRRSKKKVYSTVYNEKKRKICEQDKENMVLEYRSDKNKKINKNDKDI